MRLFIHVGTRDKLTKKYKEGGGLVAAEIMVLETPPQAQKQWIELWEKEGKETVASTGPSESLTQPAIRKVGKHKVYGF